MAADFSPSELSESVLSGNGRAVARAISWAESAHPGFTEVLSRLWPRTGRARVTGLTGSPGAGKSTMTAALARVFLAEGKRVGIVAVDPSSPFTGGAILGDRIRMQELYTDPGVMIRSMATRGHLGGLARATADAVDVLDAAGYDEVIVETVGVGQDEIEVFRLAETCVVILTPGMGDDIQAIKAGLMEVADIFVVNKSDRDGADRVVHEILQVMEMGEHGAWLPPVLKTIAKSGAGLAELRVELEKHRAFLAGPEGMQRRVARVKRRVESIVREQLLLELRALTETDGSLEAHAEAVDARREDPRAAAASLLATIRANGAVGAVGEVGAAGDPPKGAEDAGGTGRVKRISHLGVAVPSIAQATGFYDLLGLLEVHREEVASQKVLTSFRPAGESFFELLEPTSPESPIAKYLEKNRPGIHHVCLEVDDVAAALAKLKAGGVRLINETPVPGAHHCLVAFVHPASTGGILLELSQKMEG